MRCDFSGRRTSDQHQRRKWDKPLHGHDPQPDKLAACPSGLPPPRERHAEYCCLMTGQGNERGAPETFIEEETNMKYDPELAALLAQPWSNNACRGYVIYASLPRSYRCLSANQSP